MNAMQKATYGEWLASLIGACLVAAAIGIYLPKIFLSIASWALIAGGLLHTWGMVRIHRRIREDKSKWTR